MILIAEIVNLLKNSLTRMVMCGEIGPVQLPYYPTFGSTLRS